MITLKERIKKYLNHLLELFLLAIIVIGILYAITLFFDSLEKYDQFREREKLIIVK